MTPSYVLDLTAGVFLRQHDVKAGDCIAIKRMWDDSLRILINPEDLAEGRQVRCSCTPFAVSHQALQAHAAELSADGAWNL